ncbi:MAG: methyltransferase domain-containing protein [Dehalococcoidia bacterium]
MATAEEQPANPEPIDAHYGRPGLYEAIVDALRAAGKDLDALTPADLAPVDQFHIRGTAPTLELARRVGLAPGVRVLDVGGGIGGPARILAAEFGCAVTVLDLTEEFCRAGERLTALLRLGDRVAFRHGNALAMPFPDGGFDVVWTQHSSMNVADKERLYAEIRRVLKPGGRLALYEVMAGPAAPPVFPVPWAREPSLSFLRPAEAVRTLLRDAGFGEVAWEDTSAAARQWFAEQAAAARAAGGLPLLGLHLLLGPSFADMGRNMRRGLEEGRITLVQAVLERAG